MEAPRIELGSAAAVRSALASDEITVIRTVHYHQFDTYFLFDDPDQGRLRYREDELLDEQEAVAEATEIVFTSLPGPPEVEAVALGENGARTTRPRA